MLRASQNEPGAARLKVEADFDPTVRAVVELNGAPDYVFVESVREFRIFYLKEDRAVVFKRGAFFPNSKVTVTDRIPEEAVAQLSFADQQELATRRARSGEVGPASAPAAAFSPPPITAGDMTRERRIALVIGNKDYENAPLRNPINDARAMSSLLRQLGFSVTLLENANVMQMKRGIDEFGSTLLSGGVGLFYFSGHGTQLNGRNYLIPIGARITYEREVEYEAVDVGRILTAMEEARNILNLVILDACRDNPFPRSLRSWTHGLAPIEEQPSGSLIAYATKSGSVADDGPGANGLYTEALLKYLRMPGLRIEDVFKAVRVEVKERTHGRQVPWEYTSLEGDFYFAGVQR